MSTMNFDERIRIRLAIIESMIKAGRDITDPDVKKEAERWYEWICKEE